MGKEEAFDLTGCIGEEFEFVVAIGGRIVEGSFDREKVHCQIWHSLRYMRKLRRNHMKSNWAIILLMPSQSAKT
eukprot:scaffold2313_cov99-Skeletonema_marinoi.AAC.2